MRGGCTPREAGGAPAAFSRRAAYASDAWGMHATRSRRRTCCILKKGCVRERCVGDARHEKQEAHLLHSQEGLRTRAMRGGCTPREAGGAPAAFSRRAAYASDAWGTHATR